MSAHGRRVVLGIGVALVMSVGSFAQVKDPVIGTWKLNLSKSKYNPGPPPANADTQTYEDRGGGVVIATFRGVDGEGKPTFTQYAAKYDGKEYPYLVQGGKTALTISFRTIDANTIEYTIRSSGEVTGNGTRTVARDGKSFTRMAKIQQGKPVSNVVVYDRQ